MNILYFHTHDTGRFIKPYGHNVPTSNLMEFAKESILFRNAFSSSPTCSPSRATLLTGMYPHKNGMLGLAHRGFNLQNSDIHLASFLKQNGYETIIAGIQHEEGHYYKDSIKNCKKLGYDVVLTNDYTKYDCEEELHDWDKENVNSLIKYLKDRPTHKNFFMSCGLFATHRPYPLDINEDVINSSYTTPIYNVHNNEQNREDHARFLNSAYNADQNFGRIIEALKECNLYDDTLVIFTTDHGVANPKMKCTLNDLGTGVSLMIRHPKTSFQGIVAEDLISQVDIFPTICDVLNLKKPNNLDGKSFKPLFDGKDYKKNKYIYTSINFHTSYEPARAIRSERYKYIKYYDEAYLKFNYSNIDESNPKKLLIDNGLKDQYKSQEQLYDLYFDPTENNNLINNPSYKNILNELQKELQLWQKEIGDPILNGELPYPKNGKVNKKDCLIAGSKDVNDYEVHPQLTTI